MLFKRKPKNRRFERKHILDVKLRSQQARAARWRLASSLIGITLSTFLGLFVLWNGMSVGLNFLIFKNNAFAVRTIDVQTDGELSVAQLRRWAGVKLGDNLLALELARVKRDLELVPWIQVAAVERVLAHTLRIRITEREPVAQACTWKPGGSKASYEPVIFFLDGAGYVMMPQDAIAGGIEVDRLKETLPCLTGISNAQLRPGRQVESEQAQAALRLVDEFDRSPMFGCVELKEIDLASAGVLRVTTRQSNEVTLATQQLDWQLRRWRVAHDAGLKMGKAIATLDLSVSNHVPATWSEAGAGLAPKLRTIKPARTRKKNV